MTTTSLRRPLEKLGKGPRPAGPRGARGPRRGLPALPDRGWRPSGQATRTSSHGPRTGATTRCSVLRGPRALETAKCLILNESLFPVINITGNSGSLGADSEIRANARSPRRASARPALSGAALARFHTKYLAQNTFVPRQHRLQLNYETM